MRINTFIVILFITFIICNKNNHIKGQGKMSIDVREVKKCKAVLVPFVEEYKEITEMTAGSKGYVNTRRIVHINIATPAAPIYTYYSFPEPAAVTGNLGLYEFTGTKVVDFTMTSDLPTGVMNYEFPWNVASDIPPYKIKFGTNVDDAYAVGCTAAEPKRMTKLSAIDATTVAKYEKIDQYMESFTETRNDITDADIGQGIKLNWVDTGKAFSNMLLTKSQFCHYTCTIETVTANVKCNLLVYAKSKYNTKPINQAYIINFDGTPKSYIGVKADTADDKVIDTCAEAGGGDVECKVQQYTIMSKGATKILTGYYKNNKDKYVLSTAESPVMPADIKAKFSKYYYCFGDPEPITTPVQGVSNMFINCILLILIVILMI